jgi:hypothetical protein
MIDNIKIFKYVSGSYYITSVYTGAYLIEIDSKKLICKYNFKSSFYNTEIKWKINKNHLFTFFEELNSINVFLWDTKYSDENACDGGYWSISIKYNKNEIIEIIGDNAYPDNFDTFYNILEKYFPIISMDLEYRLKLESNKKFLKASANFT